MIKSKHIPVLLRESIEALITDRDGCYADVTYGSGGHSREILKYLSPRGRLIAFDRDKNALHQKIEDSRFIFVLHNFIYLTRYLKYYDLPPLSGIIADLGVSSYQLDTAEKGFSFRFEAPLDMRMDSDSELTAADILNTYPAEKLKKLLGIYGEIKNVNQLVNAILDFRQKRKFSTIQDLVSVAEKCMHKSDVRNKYLAKTFQALRMEVNEEIPALKQLLLQASRVIKKGGRMVVITFHSGEDRIVKNYFKTGTFSGKIEANILYGESFPPFRPLNKKPITPSEEEMAQNPRSRSAKLRIAEKLR